MQKGPFDFSHVHYIKCTISAFLGALEWILNSICEKIVKKVPFPKSCPICAHKHVPLHLYIYVVSKLLYRNISDQVIGNDVPLHLGQIADSMYEWEGPVAEQLGLTQADVAAIKMQHPSELRLQT